VPVDNEANGSSCEENTKRQVVDGVWVELGPRQLEVFYVFTGRQVWVQVRERGIRVDDDSHHQIQQERSTKHLK
jgi:hypothetical protein